MDTVRAPPSPNAQASCATGGRAVEAAQLVAWKACLTPKRPLGLVGAAVFSHSAEATSAHERVERAEILVKANFGIMGLSQS